MSKYISGMDTAKIVQLIETTILRRGDGDKVPIRVITQYWTMEGELVAEVDPLHQLSVGEAVKMKKEFQ